MSQKLREPMLFLVLDFSNTPVECEVLSGYDHVFICISLPRKGVSECLNDLVQAFYGGWGLNPGPDHVR